MASTSRFASSGVEDAATLKAKQVAAMLSATLTNVSQPAAQVNGMNMMMIPSSKVGMIIGKAGSRIREIENTTGVKLQLDSTGEPERKVWIQGGDDNVVRARAMIKEILEQARFGGRGKQNPTKIVSIPGDKVGLLIGAGGSTIKRFSQEHSCHLKVVSEEEAMRTNQQVPDQGFQHLHIMGTVEAAANAERAVLEFLNGQPSSMGGGRGGYGAYQQQVYQQRMQPYAAYSPQNYGALVQAYTNVGQPYINTNYAYAQPAQMYSPQGYNTQAIPGFQQYAAFPPPPTQSAPPADDLKSQQVNYASAQNVPQNVGMYQPQQAGTQVMSNQLMNNQPSPNFAGQIQNIQTVPAGTRPADTELLPVQNQFNWQQAANKGNSQSVGNPPGVPSMQQINQPSTIAYNYPVQNYSGIPQSHVASQRQPSQNQAAYDPANTGHNLQVQFNTSMAQPQVPGGSPSNSISPGNAQQVPVTDNKPPGSFQTSTAGNAVQLISHNPVIQGDKRNSHNMQATLNQNLLLGTKKA